MPCILFLVSEPDCSHGEEGSGHVPSLHLSCSPDVTNPTQTMTWKHFFCKLSVLLAIRYGKSLVLSRTTPKCLANLKGNNGKVTSDRMCGITTDC